MVPIVIIMVLGTYNMRKGVGASASINKYIYIYMYMFAISNETCLLYVLLACVRAANIDKLPVTSERAILLYYSLG